ncbi:hypothetical protein ACFL43_04795, partial [Thermodesulfobacteriota bacterium]
ASNGSKINQEPTNIIGAGNGADIKVVTVNKGDNMKNFLAVLQILALLTVLQCSNKELTNTCDMDTSKTGYDLAKEFDECLNLNAQTMTAHVDSLDITVRDTQYTEYGVFESNFAEINAQRKFVKPICIFFEEDMSAYPNAPDTIYGLFTNKMIAKDKIESYFDVTIDEPQGLCVDVQDFVYDNVYNSVLTDEQRAKYDAEGKSLSFIPDGDYDPALWVGVDPSTLVTNEGNDYYFEPYSMYIPLNDPRELPELLKGVKYCKLLSHQAILSWMLEKSFEDDPVLLSPSEECLQPSSLEARGGSCIMYFSQARSYYCSDYTGPYFTPETGAEKCADREDTSGGVLDPSYSELSCSERTEEIEASIPGYMGLTGHCIIHCNEENEFIWNIYTDNPTNACRGWDFFAPDEIIKPSE